MFKMPTMRAIAKGFVFGVTAAAKRKSRSSSQPVVLAMFIYYFKIAFYLKRAVIVDDNFCGCHKSKIR